MNDELQSERLDDCPGNEELLAFATGRLSDSDSARIESHLLLCPACPERISALDLNDDPVVAAFAAANHENSTRIASDTDSPPAKRKRPPAVAPDMIGRYRIERLIGEGGFGTVYLAKDPNLDRHVAIKVPRADRIFSAKDITAFIAEARTAARLDKHRGIVTVHDVQQGDDGAFIVQEYIDGSDLDKWVSKNSPSTEQIVRLVIEITEAIGFAHAQDFVHRDLKPSNVLVDQKGRVHITDFGLALHYSRQRENKGELAGTPEYMSPEQVRRESQFLDGRSDIWSVGVIFYELLAKRRPFNGGDLSETFDEIERRTPRSLTEISKDIPPELERICIKCLEKHAADRYASASALLADLNHWMKGAAKPPPDPPKPRIVPKGLRSFDEHDADFFLQLLPGPYRTDGLPESIHFWKTRIDNTDPKNTFRVGVMYGPSGCGKSSILRAGLLPHLADTVIPVCIDATGRGTEAVLAQALQDRCEFFPSASSLQAMLRQKDEIPAGHKVLIVIDQFEQWLHGRKETDFASLVEALIECDGSRLQALLLIRDDFFSRLQRFTRKLRIPLEEDTNTTMVDLFDPSQARRVLTLFGRAYDDSKGLPETGDLSRQQESFLDQAIEQLVDPNEGGRISCVRLSLFADLIQDRPWEQGMLKTLGGATGVGVAFLEERLSAKTAPAANRTHQRAARNVLESLLPSEGAEIKGGMQSRQELLAKSGYDGRPDDFAELLKILETQLRIITPTTPAEEEHTPGDEEYYQLTHDYLVPSLRTWLTEKKSRAERLLDERARSWNAKPENRHLPSVVEYIKIGLLTRRQQRTEPQQNMMRRASRLHGFRWGTALLLTLAGVFVLQRYVSQMRQQNLVASIATAVDALQITSGDTVPFALLDLEKMPSDHVTVELLERYNEADGQRKLTLAYALAELGEVDQTFLVASVPTAGSRECPNLVTALGNSREIVLQTLEDAIVTAGDSEDWIAKSRLAIVALHLGETEPTADMLQFEDRPDPLQRTIFIETFPKWHGNLHELATQLGGVSEPSLRSGICLAVARVEDLGDEAQQIWQKVIVPWYMKEPDAGTHSAAGWALRSWGVELPKIESPSHQEVDRDWRVTRTGLTMLRIPAGEFVRDTNGRYTRQQTVRVDRDYFLSDCEITVELFQQFIEDSEYDFETPEDWQGAHGEVSPSGEHPMQQVNWYDAVMFCIWLSHREGLEPCYERTGRKEIFRLDSREEKHDAWRLIDDASGYRLPSEAQWEYACRAGTTTLFACGDDVAWLSEYCVYVVNSRSQAAACAIKLCNAWGLFDMHGNVDEWCGDWYGEYEDESVVANPSGPDRGSGRVNRGGSWMSSAGYGQSSFRYGHDPPWDRRVDLGFRVALVPAAGKKPVTGGR